MISNVSTAYEVYIKQENLAGTTTNVLVFQPTIVARIFAATAAVNASTVCNYGAAGNIYEATASIDVTPVSTGYYFNIEFSTNWSGHLTNGISNGAELPAIVTTPSGNKPTKVDADNVMITTGASATIVNFKFNLGHAGANTAVSNFSVFSYLSSDARNIRCEYYYEAISTTINTNGAALTNAAGTSGEAPNAYTNDAAQTAINLKVTNASSVTSDGVLFTMPEGSLVVNPDITSATDTFTGEAAITSTVRTFKFPSVLALAGTQTAIAGGSTLITIAGVTARDANYATNADANGSGFWGTPAGDCDMFATNIDWRGTYLVAST